MRRSVCRQSVTASASPRLGRPDGGSPLRCRRTWLIVTRSLPFSANREGADEHAGERVEVSGLRELASRERLAQQRPSRLDEAGLEEMEQFGVAFLFGEQ